MRFAVGNAKDDVEKRLQAHGIDRRQFLKYCTAVAVAMGMGPAFAPEVAKALTGGAGARPNVVYLHNAECTGCSEAILRTSAPYIDQVLLDTVNMVYQETIMAAAGEAAEKALWDTVNSGEPFVAIVEGAIPTADNGNFGKVGNHTMLEINRKVLTKAAAVISYGTCAAYGGVQAAKPNPTGAKGINDCYGSLGVKAINIPGCPPNPINIIGTIVYYIQKGGIPPLDDQGRPKMFFGKSVHEQCERLPFFENGQFADSFDSDEARQGWCLYNLGCKGPSTYNNCPSAKFNSLDSAPGANWPVQAGHPCIGCSEPDFWDQMSPFYES
ncbi:hydrogenase small subunit [Desulfovibrio sp. OttesenSCG-928-G15]|nr:hydrogenase small subunit [Desulfovibrio sp. OttesenSCG-928-G15]